MSSQPPAQQPAFVPAFVPDVPGKASAAAPMTATPTVAMPAQQARAAVAQPRPPPAMVYPQHPNAPNALKQPFTMPAGYAMAPGGIPRGPFSMPTQGPVPLGAVPLGSLPSSLPGSLPPGCSLPPHMMPVLASSARGPVPTGPPGWARPPAPQMQPQMAAVRPVAPPAPAAPPAQVSIVLQADHGMRADTGLVLDKRTIMLNVSVLDEAGKQTPTPLGLQVVLVYEDMQPLPTGTQPTVLAGKTTFTATGGQATARLRITTISANHDRRRFRFKVMPQDAYLAQERPRLVQLSEAFTVVNHTAAKTAKPGKQLPAPTPGANGHGPPPQATPGVANGGAPTGTGAPPLTRHRYFPAEELRAATDSPAGEGPPLTRKALGLSDRLAALVAQQVTQRAWQQARRRPLREGEDRALRARDVVSAVRRPGQLDFLFHACALRRWAAADDAEGAEPEAPLLWGADPDWSALDAAVPAQPAPPPQPAPSPQQPAPQPAPHSLAPDQAESVASAAALAVARIASNAARERNNDSVNGA